MRLDRGNGGDLLDKDVCLWIFFCAGKVAFYPALKVFRLPNVEDGLIGIQHLVYAGMLWELVQLVRGEMGGGGLKGLRFKWGDRIGHATS